MQSMRRCSLFAVSVWLGFAVGVDAQGPGALRAERLRFDGREGRWVELPPPVPGTAVGDLVILQADLSAGHYKKARKAIKRWMKVYGEDSEHYPNALLAWGQTEKALRNYYRAHEILDRLMNEYAGTEAAGEGALESFNVAEVFLTGVRRKVWGIRLLSGRNTALDILDGIASQFAETSLAEQAIKTKADYYFRQGDFSLSELEYSRLVQSFPRSRYRRFAMRRSADAALASFGGIQFDDSALIEAEERYRQYALQYRGLAEQEQIGLILDDIREKRAGKELDVGAYYERTKHPEAAVYYYRSTMEHWPDTIAAQKAGRAAGRLGAPSGGPGVTTGAVEPASSTNWSERP